LNWVAHATRRNVHSTSEFGFKLARQGRHAENPVARRLRAETSGKFEWFAEHLQPGTLTPLASRLNKTKWKNESNNQMERGLV